VVGDRSVARIERAADVDAAWCTTALAAELDGARVVAVDAEPVGTGQVADTLRLRLTYDRAGAGPATLIAKVPSGEEASRVSARMTRTYEIEASFYRDLAASLAVRSPRCHYADHDPETDAYVVLLEDVAPAEQGDQLAGCTMPEIEAAVDELALLHGSRWGDDALTAIGWLHRSQPENIANLLALLDGVIPLFLGHYGPRLHPETAGVLERLRPHLPGYLHERPRPWSVVHGDFRADNLLFGLDRVVVVDWQTVGLGPPASDLAYLLGTSLEPSLRREHEAELVDRYVAGLQAQSVDADRDELWQGYRRSAYSGLLMAVIASALVHRTERGDDMFLAMADRSAEQARDLDSESLLPA
jgi:hypothetical protein